MRLSNMKIGVRLAAGFCLLLGLIVAIIAVSVLEMKQINDKLERIVGVNNPQVKLSYEMLDSVHVVARVIRSVALLDDMTAKQSEKKKIDDARKKYNDSEQKFEKLLNTEEGRAILEKAKRLKEESRSVNDRIMELAMANKREEAVKALLHESQPKVAVWQDTLYELAEYAEGRTMMRSEQARQSYETAFIIMMAIGGVSLALALLTAALITRSITNPVSGLVKAATVASSGDLTADIKVDTKDEIGKLSGAFKEMIDQMRELVRQIAEKAAAVSASSQQLNSSALQTSASANENASTMGEIATTVEQVTSNVQEISASSETAASQATEGNRGIVRVTDQMKVIAGASNEASEVLNGLNKKSQEISQIVELITSIADQTNLLALNAAIEAARAGDQGRGFAVVAEEVRKLAEQSASAAKEIYLLINAIQAESQKAVQSMAQGVREVEAGTEVVREVGDKFKEIIGAVEGLTSQIQEVASATEQMSAGVQNVAASTEEQTAAMEEVSASAESLSGLAEELNRLVSRFKV